MAEDERFKLTATFEESTEAVDEDTSAVDAPSEDETADLQAHERMEGLGKAELEAFTKAQKQRYDGSPVRMIESPCPCC